MPFLYQILRYEQVQSLTEPFFGRFYRDLRHGARAVRGGATLERPSVKIRLRNLLKMGLPQKLDPSKISSHTVKLISTCVF